jgi:hypothetical protein
MDPLRLRHCLRQPLPSTMDLLLPRRCLRQPLP